MQQMVLYCKNLLFARHVSGTIMPIIRSSRLLYRWLLPVVLGALVYRLLVWCGAVGYVSGLRDSEQHPANRTHILQRDVALHPANRTHNLQLHT